ncbi:MAG: hypothetical protein F6K42_29695 [Leptolyngbya sp. SIO1D8]|nr:hypothetical protein [Leptolyngbya sp. SIO1D8]
MNPKLTVYEELEGLPAGSLQPSSKAALFTKSLFQEIMRMLVPSTEPKIQSRLTQDGHTVFDAYDPVTHQRLLNASEVELRFWLEQLPYITSPFR